MRGFLAIPAALLLLLPAAALYLNSALAQAVGAPAAIALREQPSIKAPAQAPVDQQAGTQTAASSGQADLTTKPPSATTAPSNAPPNASDQEAAAPMSTVSRGQPSTWTRAPRLAEAVSEAMADFLGDYSVVVQELESGQRWTYNPEQAYHPASTIKMPVTLYALEQYRAGKAGWQDLIQYTQADFETPGGGAFETAPFGGLYPVENLVGRALRYSNNVAVNMLGRHFGWANIEAWTKTIGGDLYREENSPRVTALSELGWWLHLDKLSQEDPKSAELLLQPLRKVAYNGRITAGLPPSVPHLHKFGSYDGNYHDGAIIFAEKPYILIVMTYGAAVNEADAAIARVSAEIYRVMIADEA